MLKAILPALVAVGLVALGPVSDVFAQKGGGGGGRGGGGGGGGGGRAVGGGGGGRAVGGASMARPAAASSVHMSGYSGTMHAGAYHNGAYHNGYYHNGNYYHNHYYPYFFGSIYFGNPFWYNYAPGYADYGYGYANGYASSYPYEAPPIMTTPPSQSLPPEQSGPPNGSAQIDVVLPTVDAKVYIDGAPMASGSGMQRSFISPPLEQGYSYSYRLTAEWTTPDGQPMRIERVVPVAPGRLSIMDFTRVNPNQAMPPNQAAPPAPKMPLAPR